MFSPLPVDRDRLPGEGVEDHHRDELLGEMIGAVVVGAVAEHHRQPVGLSPGADQVIGGRLGGRIGAAGIVGRGLAELARGTQGAEDLVGRDVVEAEALRLALPQPVAPRRLQQIEGAHDIRLNEIPRPVDRAVDVAFGREVHHRVGPVRREDPLERLPVADVGMLEGVERRARDLRQIVEAGGVGEGVEVDDRMAAADREPHNGRADEAGAAGHQELHVPWPQTNGD
jgi:hypothetical protein